MRLFSYRGLSLLLLVAAAMPIVGCGALADELFVMPYSCRVAGGRPVLTPSDDQGHPVIGRRDQQEFRACSPVNPRLCRRWNVHRFDLDCGGVRVPWVEVAAAAEGARDGRAYVSGGRLELEMPAQWSLPPDAPCARMEPSEGGWDDGGFRRFCAERLAGVRPITVEMPRGFAPMLGIDGIFVADKSPRAMADVPPRAMPDAASPRSAHREPEAKIAPAKPAPAKAAPAKPPAESEPPSTSGETTTAFEPPIPEPVRKPAREATGSVQPAPQPEPPKADAPKTEPPKAGTSSAGGAIAGAGPVIPKMINGESASRADAPLETGATGSAPSSAPAAPTPSTPAASSPPASDAPQTVAQSQAPPDPVAAAGQPSLPSDPGISAAIPVELVGGPADDDTVAIAAGALAVFILLTLAAVLWRKRTRSASAFSRDIAAVSFDKRAPKDEQVPTLSALPVVTASSAARHDLEPSLSTPPAPWGDAIPRTREEAMRVLGMGIAPDVNEAAIKKIIDGLRLSWHPDHASSPADRVTRELRLKQINVAWDIITGQRRNGSSVPGAENPLMS